MGVVLVGESSSRLGFLARAATEPGSSQPRVGWLHRTPAARAPRRSGGAQPAPRRTPVSKRPASRTHGRGRARCSSGHQILTSSSSSTSSSCIAAFAGTPGCPGGGTCGRAPPGTAGPGSNGPGNIADSRLHSTPLLRFAETEANLWTRAQLQSTGSSNLHRQATRGIDTNASQQRMRAVPRGPLRRRGGARDPSGASASTLTPAARPGRRRCAA